MFHLSEKTDAVIAEYRPNTTSESFKLMLIRYPDNDTARIVFDDVLKLWRSWGETESTSGAVHTFQSKAQRYTSCLLERNILGMAFLSINKGNAETLLQSIAHNMSK